MRHVLTSCFLLLEVSSLILGQTMTTTPDSARTRDVKAILAELDDGIIGGVGAGAIVGIGAVIAGGQFGNVGR